MEDFWQGHYQIYLMVLLKDFIKLNVNTGAMIKKCGTCRIIYKECKCFLEYRSVKDDLKEYQHLFCNSN